MGAIREWAYTLCIASVLLGVLQGILPVKNLSSVIKLVLSLYILLLLMAPAGSYAQQGFALVLEPVSQAETPDIDLTQAVARQTEAILDANLTRALAAAKIATQNVEVSGQITDGEFIIQKVLVRTQTQPDTTTLEQIFIGSLGCVPDYDVLVTDGIKND